MESYVKDCILENGLSCSDITELDLVRWPVNSVYTHIAYSNLYCAICNGALEGPWVNNSDTARLDALVFWEKVWQCAPDLMDGIHNRSTKFDPKMLEEWVQLR